MSVQFTGHRLSSDPFPAELSSSSKSWMTRSLRDGWNPYNALAHLTAVTDRRRQCYLEDPDAVIHAAEQEVLKDEW